MNRDDLFKKVLALYIISMVFDSFDLTTDIWSFQVKFSSIFTPKNLVTFTLETGLLPIVILNTSTSSE